MAAFERATVGLVLWWSANNAFAADPDGALAVSRLGVAETAERFEADARSRGCAVVGHVDHAGGAQRNGLRIPAVRTLLIDEGSGFPPKRVVVWRAPSGVTVVALVQKLVPADDRAAGEVPPSASTAAEWAMPRVGATS